MGHAITREVQKNLDQSPRPELEGLAIRRVLVKSSPARVILQTAQVEKADLIIMPCHGYTFEQFLLGSVRAKVLHGSECFVWTGAHVEESERPSQSYNPLLDGGVNFSSLRPAGRHSAFLRCTPSLRATT